MIQTSVKETTLKQLLGTQVQIVLGQSDGVYISLIGQLEKIQSAGLSKYYVGWSMRQVQAAGSGAEENRQAYQFMDAVIHQAFAGLRGGEYFSGVLVIEQGHSVVNRERVIFFDAANVVRISQGSGRHEKTQIRLSMGKVVC